MSKFRELNIGINNLLLQIVQNQNLLKYIYYTDGDPLSNPNIDNIDKILFKQIFPFPFTPEVITEQTSVFNVILGGFQRGQNSYFKEGNIYIDFLCHQNIWRLNNGNLRPFAILEEVDSIFNLKNGIVGVGKLQFSSANIIFGSDKFVGYRAIYKIISTA